MTARPYDSTMSGGFSLVTSSMLSRRKIAARPRLRTAVQWCVYLLLAAGLVQTWLLDGLVIPYRVSGGSMAPRLLGAHRQVMCADCGYAFPCDADVRPVAPRAVCPNCGYAANELESSLPDVAGDRVLIDRAAFDLHLPRRWEIVALRRAQQAGEVLVKRVVGLPGESIEIRNGDVYVNGQIQRKSLAEQRALAIPVYDANFPPTQKPQPPPRWRAERSTSTWVSTGGRFVHAARRADEPIDWLRYHHWQRLMGASGAIRASPVTDICGYNQSQPRREEDVHAVADVMVSFRLEPIGNGTFFVRATDGGEPFEVRLHFLGKGPGVWEYEAFRGGRPIPGASGRVNPARRRLVEVSLVDQQFLLAIDGQTLVAWPYDRPPRAPSPPPTPFDLGVEADLDVTVDQLRVYRDVYYTHPIGQSAQPEVGQPVRLAADEYFVLGDNSPVSEDSRTWPEGGAVEAKLLVGKPLVAIPSAPIASWGHCDIQVPNPAEIRYIR